MRKSNPGKAEIEAGMVEAVQEEGPPFLRTWKNLYWLVFGNLLLWITFFTLFTWAYR